jgi:hypothetical protein
VDTGRKRNFLRVDPERHTRRARHAILADALLPARMLLAPVELLLEKRMDRGLPAKAKKRIVWRRLSALEQRAFADFSFEPVNLLAKPVLQSHVFLL